MGQLGSIGRRGNPANQELESGYVVIFVVGFLS